MRPPRKAAGLLAAALVTPGAVALAARSTAGAPKGAKQAFGIRGSAALPLRPGTSQPLDLVLVNRRRGALWVTSLRILVAVDPRHSAAGCAARRDFAVRDLPARAYPIRLPGRAARRLSALGVRTLPRLGMRDLAHVDQNACKGATLRLRYSGTALGGVPKR